MRGDERERIAVVDLYVDFGEPAADAETPAGQKEVVVRVRPAGGEGEAAEDGDVDVGVETRDVFPERKVESIGLERRAEFEQRVGRAHFLEREDVGLQRADALADPGFAFRGLGVWPRV